MADGCTGMACHAPTTAFRSGVNAVLLNPLAGSLATIIARVQIRRQTGASNALREKPGWTVWHRNWRYERIVPDEHKLNNAQAIY